MCLLKSLFSTYYVQHTLPPNGSVCFVLLETNSGLGRKPQRHHADWRRVTANNDDDDSDEESSSKRQIWREHEINICLFLELWYANFLWAPSLSFLPVGCAHFVLNLWQTKTFKTEYRIHWGSPSPCSFKKKENMNNLNSSFSIVATHYEC